MATRTFKITNVACIIFLLEGTTLDNYQKSCFHSSPVKNTTLSSSSHWEWNPCSCLWGREVDDAELPGLCLPLQPPSGCSLQSCWHLSQNLQVCTRLEGFAGCSRYLRYFSPICFHHLSLISNVTSSERPSLPSCGRQDNDPTKRSMSYSLESVMLSYKAKENFQIRWS